MGPNDPSMLKNFENLSKTSKNFQTFSKKNRAEGDQEACADLAIMVHTLTPEVWRARDTADSSTSWVDHMAPAGSSAHRDTAHAVPYSLTTLSLARCSAGWLLCATHVRRPRGAAANSSSERAGAAAHLLQGGWLFDKHLRNTGCNAPHGECAQDERGDSFNARPRHG